MQLSVNLKVSRYQVLDRKMLGCWLLAFDLWLLAFSLWLFAIAINCIFYVFYIFNFSYKKKIPGNNQESFLKYHYPVNNYRVFFSSISSIMP